MLKRIKTKRKNTPSKLLADKSSTPTWLERIHNSNCTGQSRAKTETDIKGATKLYFTHYSCAVIILYNAGLYKSAFSTYLFKKLVVLSFCTFCAYFFCVELDVIVLTVYIACVIKIRLQLLIKNMPPGSFWVLKKSFIKENVNIHKMKECKRNAIDIYFFSRKFKTWKIHFGPLVLAALKCYCGDDGHNMQTSFKTFVSKNAATWRLHQTSG